MCKKIVSLSHDSVPIKPEVWWSLLPLLNDVWRDFQAASLSQRQRMDRQCLHERERILHHAYRVMRVLVCRVHKYIHLSVVVFLSTDMC